MWCNSNKTKDIMEGHVISFMKRKVQNLNVLNQDILTNCNTHVRLNLTDNDPECFHAITLYIFQFPDS